MAAARNRMRIAIVGSGIAGNVAAHRLHAAGHEITMFESGDHVGGHTHTHDILLGGGRFAVDTGFIVFNTRTYPRFCALLEELGVESQVSSMSFSVRDDASGLEYNGTSCDGLFAQRRNLLRPRFLHMLAEIVRFNGAARELLGQPGPELTLAEFLAAHHLAGAVVHDYLVPMGAAIWSTDPAQMMNFPARFFARFLHNHGMLNVNDRPTWRVIRGGSARYVERLTAPWRERVRLRTPVTHIRRLPDAVLVSTQGHAAEHFDHVFLACHADQALALLADPTPEERAVLGALPYQRNEVVLHTDTTLLPRNRRAWAAWNYHRAQPDQPRVTLTYNMNILQDIRAPHTFCVTLNEGARIDPARVLKRLQYDHPLFTPASIAAQRRHAEISGAASTGWRTHYCGAYWRYGFHEDGVISAENALLRFDVACDAQRDLSRVA
jgi:predicted NAD/FAD-binding protein